MIEISPQYHRQWKAICHTNDVYRCLYLEYGPNLTKEKLEMLFSTSIPKALYPILFVKYMRLGQAFERKRTHQRLASARHRLQYFTQRVMTDDQSITASSVIALLKEQDFCCAICETYLVQAVHKQLDHIRPLSKGGSHTLTNVQWLCRTCNIRKNNHYAEEEKS